MLKIIKSEEMLLPRRTWYMNDEGFFEEILVNGKTVKGRYHQIMDDGSIGLPICTKDCEGCLRYLQVVPAPIYVSMSFVLRRKNNLPLLLIEMII